MKIVFMGTPAAAAESLRRLLGAGHEVVAVYTQPDRPSGRGNKIAFSPVKEIALENDLPLYQPTKIKTDEALQEFRSRAADVAVVVAYGRILPAGFLNAFAIGAINVHFSLLPKYRGAAPVNWAIVNGEEMTGVTTIKMDEGLDTGDILVAEETPIGKQETAPELMDRLAELGADVLLETLATLPDIVPRPQDHSAATFAPIMKREDGKIDWALPARDIANRVRGFQPFPGSFSFLNGKRVVFWSVFPVKMQAALKADRGEIVEATDGSVVVAAGEDTFIRVDEIQFEGKKRVSVRELLNSGQIAVGQRFA